MTLKKYRVSEPNRESKPNLPDYADLPGALLLKLSSNKSYILIEHITQLSVLVRGRKRIYVEQNY